MIFLHMLLVGVGGFFGAMARFAVNQLVSRINSINFPLATLTVNIVGSFLLGFTVGNQFDRLFMLWLGIGFFGSFTTFSTFTLESVQLFTEKKHLSFLLYQVLSFGGAIAGALLGLAIARLI